MIYLDNAATTQVHPAVLEEMLPYLGEEYGNPSSVYRMGRRANDAIQIARDRVAKFLHTTPEHIVFTSGGSEGNNMILRGVAEHLRKAHKRKIVTTPTEHPSVLRVMDYFIKLGFYVQYLPIDTHTGAVEEDEIDNYINDDVGLVSVMYVNNETGAINPVERIALACKRHGALFHSDCVQAAAALDINVEETLFDFVTISGHKLHAPKGIGAVYIRSPQDFATNSPLIFGGEDQEFGFRGGTENVPGIVALGKACELLERPTESRELFLRELLDKLDAYEGDLRWKIYLNGSKGTTHNILNIEVDSIDAETLVLAMDAKGVCISAGSACHSLSVEPSHVLKAMGLSDKEARSSVRISFSSFQPELEILEAADIMAECIYRLNQLGNVEE